MQTPFGDHLSMLIFIITKSFHSESFEKKDLDFNTAASPQAFGDSVVSKRHRELAQLKLRGSGSSSAWCSAHNVSTAAGRMFEDPEPLSFS
jgi:hypothetical protein